MRKSRGSEEIRMNGEWELVEGRGAVRRTQDAGRKYGNEEVTPLLIFRSLKIKRMKEDRDNGGRVHLIIIRQTRE